MLKLIHPSVLGCQRILTRGISARTRTSENLRQVLDISEVEARKAVTKYHQLTSFSLDKLAKAARLWSIVEIEVDDLRHFPWMLLRSNYYVMKRRHQLFQLDSLLNAYRGLPSWAKCPLVGAFPFKRTKFSIEQFSKSGECSIDYLKSFGDRVDYFAKALKMDEYHVIQQCMRHSEMFSQPVEAIQRMTTLLREAGVTSEEIQADLWVYKNSYDLAKKRVELSQEKQLKFKTWMTRAPEVTIENHINRVESFRKVLGNNDVSSFLQKKLECSGAEVSLMERRNPRLLTIHPAKIEAIFDFLLTQGFSAEDMQRHPRIFSLSLETVMNRSERLRKEKGVRLSYFNWPHSKYQSRFGGAEVAEDELDETKTERSY
ncbi:hypothetical protein HDE_01174 [Halotydeus destructor]|nr:hypothetical protein HDE_01174 [Halotydeus destructor]